MLSRFYSFLSVTTFIRSEHRMSMLTSLASTLFIDWWTVILKYFDLKNVFILSMRIWCFHDNHHHSASVFLLFSAIHRLLFFPSFVWQYYFVTIVTLDITVWLHIITIHNNYQISVTWVSSGNTLINSIGDFLKKKNTILQWNNKMINNIKMNLWCNLMNRHESRVIVTLQFNKWLYAESQPQLKIFQLNYKECPAAKLPGNYREKMFEPLVKRRFPVNLNFFLFFFFFFFYEIL